MEREKLVSLVTAAQNGDGVAMNDLFNAFYNDVYYFALKTVKDDQTACDVTQETFIEIINTLGKLQEPAAFVTWMKQITYHQCTRYFKKKKDVIVDEDEDGNTVFDTLQEEKAEFIPDEALDKEDFRKTVMTFVDDLSEEQRAAVMMFYFDEMSIKDIAQAQNVSENTIKSRLNYARKGIKKSVEDYEKKTGVKLYGVGVLPLLVWLFKGVFAETMAPAAAGTVASGVTAATGTTVVASVTATATAATATATAAATTATAAASTATASAASAGAAAAVGIGAKLAAIPLVTKIIAVVAAVAVVGGTSAAVVLTQDDGAAQQGDGSTQQGSGDKTPVAMSQTEIPDGMTYTLSDGTVLEAGDKFPAECTPGDKVEYGDYYYGYECVYMKNIPDADDLGNDWVMCSEFYITATSGEKFLSYESGLADEDIIGHWLPMVKDTSKTSYGMPLASINGKNIGALYCTYFGCENMKTAPAIPLTVTSLAMTYAGCTALETAPVIPRSVRRLTSTFRDCSSLSGDIVFNGKLDNSVAHYSTFLGVTGSINLTGEATLEDWQSMAMYPVKAGANVYIRGAIFASSEPFDEPAEGEHYHEFTESVLQAATCLSGGKKQYVCKICDATYVDSTGKTSHNWDSEHVDPMVGKPEPPVRHCTVCGVEEELRPHLALHNAFEDFSLGLIFRDMYYWNNSDDGFTHDPNVYTASNIWLYMNMELARVADEYETAVSAEEFFAETNKYFVLTEELKTQLKALDHAYDAATDTFTYRYDGEASGIYGPVGYIHNGGNRYTVYFDYAQGIEDDEPVDFYKIELEYNRLDDPTVPNRYLSIEVVEELPSGLSVK